MVFAFWRAASRTGAPLSAAAYLWQSNLLTRCDAQPIEEEKAQPKILEQEKSAADETRPVEGMSPVETGDYHEMFPKRQLWQPRLEYPLWDSNWDLKEPPSTGDVDEFRRRMRHIRKTGVTRHIILIRHGQYDESSKEDEKRRLTPLGIRQAELTGKRLAEIFKGAEEDFGPCRFKGVVVSGMTRAKETADIIASYLPDVDYLEPDPLLNEGRPCHHIPGVKATEKMIEATDHNHPRIEQAFRKYFYRADHPDAEKILDEVPNPQSDEAAHVEPLHEFEIIVCHANVIRYFLCRALQLPPEAWLRYCPFNCSLTYLTIRPTGTVSCRLVGDIGHLPYDANSFSKHHGFNW